MPTDLNLLAAEGYFELEMFEDALEELETAAASPANRLPVAAMRLNIFIAQHRWEDALPWGEVLCKLDPEEPGHFIQYAYALRETGKIEDARNTLLNGPTKLKESAVFYYNLACYEALLGESAAALHTLQRAFTLDPELRKHAETDSDLDSIRDRFPEAD